MIDIRAAILSLRSGEESERRRVVDELGRSGRPEAIVGAGRTAGIGPADLVGAITGEAGIKSRTLGSIEIADGFSIVEVPRDKADVIITALRKTRIRGRKVTVNRDRGARK